MLTVILDIDIGRYTSIHKLQMNGICQMVYVRRHQCQYDKEYFKFCQQKQKQNKGREAKCIRLNKLFFHRTVTCSIVFKRQSDRMGLDVADAHWLRTYRSTVGSCCGCSTCRRADRWPTSAPYWTAGSRRCKSRRPWFRRSSRP